MRVAGLRSWFTERRSLLVGLISGTTLIAVVATVAIVSTGFTAQHLLLGDGAVWVANNQQQAIGRANPDVFELNSVVSSTGNDLQVLQNTETVLLVDHTENKVDIVDPATSKVTDSVALPPNQPEVYLAGDTVVIVERGTGAVWIVRTAALSSFDAQSSSSLNLGANSVVSVDPTTGAIVAFAPQTGLLYHVDAAHSEAVSTTKVAPISDASGVGITSVAGHWAVLDSLTNALNVDGRAVNISGLVGNGTGAVLQIPASSGSAVLVAYSGGLISVPLAGGIPVALSSGQSGAPARPVTIAGCTFAAWTNGTTWRACGEPSDPTKGTSLPLAAMAGSAVLEFATNGARAVLNDVRSGATWAIQRTGELIDNWSDLIVAADKQPQQKPNDASSTPQIEKAQVPPVAIDDAFGARPGRATVLPVLLNDYDANGDVVVISDVTALDPTIGFLDLINQQQQIQLTLTPTASGVVTFRYSITDGRGGTASALVVVTVRTAAQNSPPEQVRTTRAVVQAGGRVTTQALSDWVDPDGDAMYLTSASVAAPDSVSYKPDGTVVFSSASDGATLALVTLVVSDGTATGSGTLSVTVDAPGDVPIVADPFVVLAYAGQEITVSPLAHVHGGSGTLRLNSVPAKPDSTITPSYESGTFRFSSTLVHTQYLDYVVTDGSQTVTGVVRIDVAAPPDVNSKPITVPKTIFVTTLRTEVIDVAGTDVDPAGGVLLVTGLLNVPPTSGVRAEILDQRTVRVSLDKPLAAPVSFNYRISNGLAESQGVITVVEIPTPTRVQPPIANDDSVTVRVGQAIDIPVLANDEHPDGLGLTLDSTLDQPLPPDSGLLFASGQVLRYLAPNQPGNFTAAYRVSGPDGQSATGLVRIAVREPDVATNNAPVPATVTARVIAGQTVRIPIPLTGIDPDGDSVQLLGQATNPQKGAVIGVTADVISYQAGEYSAGTDEFTYTVIDALGAKATGTVRVGISARLEGARNPVANLDEVTVRPGVTVSVQVLANDSDPDGSPLTVLSAQPNDATTTAVVVGDVVDVTPPEAPGSYGVIYTIQNDSGGTSQNFIRVTVDPNAPLARPVVTDSTLTLSDVLDRDRVTVDVLANVFFADGNPRDLGLSVYPGYDNVATVTADKRIEVTVGNLSQIIPFKVTNPTDASIFSYAFIRVPGYSDALPQLDRRAPALTVKSEDQLVINLNDYVIAVGGKQVRLTDASTVQATHANGDDLVRDNDTLVYTSASKYFGPASISFQVTDGASATDPNGRTATLVLPITVLPRENQPPAFAGAVIEFEPGQEKTIDLLKLTNYPYSKDLAELSYSLVGAAPVGFSYTLAGTMLTLRADDSAVKGSATSMTLGVRDAINDGRAGRIDLTIVASTRPLLKPAPDSAIVTRGTSTAIDVLTNDQATNPFPTKPLTVVGIRGLDGSNLPAGITVQPSSDKSTLAVSVATNAPTGDVSLQYQVADATNDPDRYVWGSVTISVQDRPDAVSSLTATGFGDRQLTMRWNAGASNNSPITSYRVTTTAPSGSTIASTTCSGTTCTVATPGNGSANAVLVTVVAINAIGESSPVTLSNPVWSDVIPAAPSGLTYTPLDGGLAISWDDVPTPPGGTAVTGFAVSVGANVETLDRTAYCSAGHCALDTIAHGWSLSNGSPYAVTVSARNDAYQGLAAWNSSTLPGATPAGPPVVLGTPLASVATDTTVQFDWSGVFGDNGRPITSYSAAAYTGAVPTCSSNGTVTANGATVIGPLSATTATFTVAVNSTYSLIVFAYNGQGCTASPAVVAHTWPPIVTALTVAPATAGPDGLHYDFALSAASMGTTTLTSDYTLRYRLIGDVSQAEYGPVALGDALLADQQQYGHAVSIQVRACRTYDSNELCQPQWSNSFALGTPVDLSVTGLSFVPSGGVLNNGGTFSWVELPSGDYTAVDYSCSTSPNGGNFTPAGGAGSCQGNAYFGQTFYLTVRVKANGTQYVTAYPGQ